eukprot:INCI19254.1.p1 GENE.INCI19254.1~~INCI19254.1.p1  ORF type:complete len:392 (-),score=75.19 INCI19254.1:821-1996(-)
MMASQLASKPQKTLTTLTATLAVPASAVSVDRLGSANTNAVAATATPTAAATASAASTQSSSGSTAATAAAPSLALRLATSSAAPDSTAVAAGRAGSVSHAAATEAATSNSAPVVPGVGSNPQGAPTNSSTGTGADSASAAPPRAYKPFRRAYGIPRSFLGYWTSKERNIPGSYDFNRKIIVRPCVHVRSDIAYPLPELMYVEWENDPGDGRKPFFLKVRFNQTVGTFEVRDVRQRISWTGWFAADATANEIVWKNKRLTKETNKHIKKKRGRKKKRKPGEEPDPATQIIEPSMVWVRRDMGPGATEKLHSQVVPSLCRVKLDVNTIAPTNNTPTPVTATPVAAGVKRGTASVAATAEPMRAGMQQQQSPSQPSSTHVPPQKLAKRTAGTD